MPPSEPKPARPPTPVRDAMEPGARRATEPEPTVEERALEVDGRDLVVRVQGVALGGPKPGRAGLLLLAFFEPGADGPLRERLVAGRALTELDEAVLRRAWSEGSAPKGPGERADIFADSVGDRRRGR